jgi:hypothetical protein
MLSIYCDNINNQKSSNTKYTPNQIWTKGFIKSQSNTTIPIKEKAALIEIKASFFLACRYFIAMTISVKIIDIGFAKN